MRKVISIKKVKKAKKFIAKVSHKIMSSKRKEKAIHKAEIADNSFYH